MIENLADCNFKHVLIIGSVLKYRRGLAMAMVRLLDQPRFSAMDPNKNGLPEHDYPWHEVDLVVVDMSENKSAIRSWYFDIVTQTPLPMVIFFDRSATIDDAGDMIRAGGSDYLDITRVSPKRLARALLIAANMRLERPLPHGSQKPEPPKKKASAVVTEAASVETKKAESAETEITTDLLPTVRPHKDKAQEKPAIELPSGQETYAGLSDDDGMNDEPTEVLPRLHPSTLKPVMTDEEQDNSLKNEAFGPTSLPQEQTEEKSQEKPDRLESDAQTDVVATVDDPDADEHEDISQVSFITTDVMNQLNEGKEPENKHLYVHTGYTDEMAAYKPEEEDDGMSEASFVTTGLMAILERTDNDSETALPENRGEKAGDFSMGQRWPFTPAEIEAGTAALDQFRVLDFVAVGGTASVFKVQEKDSKHIYAMKLFDTDTPDRQGQKRFLRGYQLIEKLRNPHIVPIHHLAISAGNAYAIMEYFPAGDLKARIQKGIERRDIINYAAQIAAALDAAHQQDILHRDLKPSNVMFRANGELALLDFGIAKLMAESQTGLTFSGQVVGTPHYISPEQAVGSPLDGRSDLYSLGIMLYEMIEGKRPYRGESSLEIMRQHVSGVLPSLTSSHDPLNAVISKLLSKERNKRYASGLEVIQALASAVPGVIEDELLKAG